MIQAEKYSNFDTQSSEIWKGMKKKEEKHHETDYKIACQMAAFLLQLLSHER